MWLWWAACLILGVPAALAIVSSWGGLVAALRAGRGYVAVPVVFGATGAVACRLCPAEAVRSLWWLPLVLDLGCLVLVFTAIALVWHPVARLTGRRSPFDPPDPVPEGGPDRTVLGPGGPRFPARPTVGLPGSASPVRPTLRNSTPSMSARAGPRPNRFAPHAFRKLFRPT